MNRRDFIVTATNIPLIAASAIAAPVNPRIRGTGGAGRIPIYAHEYGLSSAASADENTSILLRIRDMMASHSLHQYDLFLPPGTLEFKTARWLQGVRNVRVMGGPTLLRNVLISRSTTERIPLLVNQDIFLDDAGSLPGFGKYVTGTKIASSVAGVDEVRLLEPASKQLTPGSTVLIYGYNQDSAGYPPSIRYFELNTVVSISSNVITLAKALQHDYDSRWADIDQAGHGPTGSPRILSLSRDGFTIADYIELNDLVFLPSDGALASGKVNSLNGSLYTCSAKKIVCNRLIINGYMYPSACGEVELNDCKVRFIENDKLVTKITYKNCELEEVSNGPAVDEIDFVNCIIKRPIANLTAKKVNFVDTKFVNDQSLLHQFVALSGSTPMTSVQFIRPHLKSLRGPLLPLTGGGGVISFTVKSVTGTTIFTNFTGVGDSVVRGLQVGSKLTCRRHVNVQLVIAQIYQSGPDTAIQVEPFSSESIILPDDILTGNICRSIVVEQPNLDVSSSYNFGLTNPLDICASANADVVTISDRYHQSKKISFDFQDLQATLSLNYFDILVLKKIKAIDYISDSNLLGKITVTGYNGFNDLLWTYPLTSFRSNQYVTRRDMGDVVTQRIRFSTDMHSFLECSANGRVSLSW